MTTEDEARADALAHFDQQTNGAWLNWPDHQKEDAVADYVAGYLAGAASRVSPVDESIADPADPDALAKIITLTHFGWIEQRWKRAEHEWDERKRGVSS